MRNLRIRHWSTPATIGAGIFVALTGLLMFFVTERPFKFAHELVGIAFSVAVVLHVLSHWRSFRRYFSKRLAVGVLALVWTAAGGLIAASVLRNIAEPEDLIVARLDGVPIELLAPVVGMDVGELLERLANDGYAADESGMSVRELADRHGAESDDVLLSVFR
ncbi:DUF4405 domain-containing protein [Candidatus Palauibacter sp.]|uniref:DUF4405 domain-containing protein n=1 Tax=Candidatus Palauibacter sp. TaxID=3101350 RepID=UPI003B01C0A5